MIALVLVARVVLAGVFLIAGVAKLRDRRGTRDAVRGFGVTDRVASQVAVALPLAELAVAALLLAAPTQILGGAAALGLLALFSTAIGVNLALGRTPDCNCFGRLYSAGTGWRAIARNIVFGALAVVVLAGGLAGVQPSLLASPRQLDTAGLAVLAASAVTVAFALALLSVTRSYGRILLRLEAVEQRLAEVDDTDGEELTGDALELGSAVPPIAFESLAGATVALDELGEDALVVAWNPGCGFCRSVHERLLAWERRAPAGSPRLVIVSAGERAETAAEGFASLVLLDPEFAVGPALGLSGTPMAMLLDREGRVASEPVAGAEAVLELAAAGARLEATAGAVG